MPWTCGSRVCALKRDGIGGFEAEAEAEAGGGWGGVVAKGQLRMWVWWGFPSVSFCRCL